MKSETKRLVEEWADKWEAGDYLNLPISNDFKHTSPYGTIESKERYIEIVDANKEQFLGYQFEVHDEIYDEDKACVRYTGTHPDFKLEVSEWYFIRNDEIAEVVAYFNIGELESSQELQEPK